MRCTGAVVDLPGMWASQVLLPIAIRAPNEMQLIRQSCVVKL